MEPVNPAQPTADQEPREGAGVELARMLGILRRAMSQWKLVAVIVFLGVAAGVAVALIRKPSFKSETIVIYRQGVRIGEDRGGPGLTLGTRLQEMLLARSRLEVISDELGLYQKTKDKLGPTEAVEEFRKDITFKPRSSDTFSISYKGKDPETVAKVTARLAQSLIDENQRLRVEQARVQREFLELERSRAESGLKEKERVLARFLSEHPEFALDQNATTPGAALRAQRQAQIAAAAPGGRDAASDALRRQAARIDAALTEGVVPSSVEVRADPELEAAKNQAESSLAQARSELGAKRASYTEQHPDVIAAKAKVASAEAALKTAEEKVAANRMAKLSQTPSTDPEAAKVKLREKKREIEAKLAAAKEKEEKGAAAKDTKTEAVVEEATGIVGLETEWARLSRDVSESRDQMNELERNYFRAQIEASSSLGGYSDQVVVLDPAYTPTKPEAPGKSLIVALAGAAALMFAGILALLRALLDDHVYEEADLARVAPVLAVVPRASGGRWFRR
jgi:uncharacterized protein involved in exopolysaccharide biosynthesis